MECGHELSAIDLIPVFSYAISGGKCRYCGKKISARYPIAELSFMLMSLVLFLHTGSDFIVFYKNWILTGCLFAIALVDLESFEIPDKLLITALVSWIVFSILEIILGRYGLRYFVSRCLTGVGVLAVMLILSLVMDKLLKKESLGGGDIKLLALLGLYLGVAGTYELIFLSCILGLIFAFIRKRINPNATKEFPFGPAIAMSAYLVLIVGDSITAWYVGLL